MEALLALLIGTLAGIGVWLVLRARSFDVILGLTLLSYAVNLFIAVMGRVGARLYEPHEQRMRFHRARKEFGVKLARHHKGVVFDLHDLHQFPVRGYTRKDHTAFFEFIEVGVVELKPVTVTFLHLRNPVCFRGFRARFQITGVQSQPHRPAHIGDGALIELEVDDRKLRAAIEFRGVGILVVEGAAGEIDAHHLHSKAQTKIRDLLFTGVPRREDLALDAA